MTGFAAPFRAVAVAGACAALAALLLAAPAAAQGQQAQPSDFELLQADCGICHSAHRVYRIKPEEIRPVLERMRKLNPDWMTDAKTEHIAKVIAKVIDSPQAVEARDAWDAAVARGKALFTSPDLGTNGKSCVACHPAGSLRNIVDAFPKFDPELKRFVDLNEAVNRMIQKRMDGQPLPPNDQKYFDLLAYLKTL